MDFILVSTQFGYKIYVRMVRFVAFFMHLIFSLRFFSTLFFGYIVLSTQHVTQIKCSVRKSIRIYINTKKTEQNEWIMCAYMPIFRKQPNMLACTSIYFTYTLHVQGIMWQIVLLTDRTLRLWIFCSNKHKILQIFMKQSSSFICSKKRYV